MKRTQLLNLIGVAFLFGASASADDGKPIFNGKDLTGWEGNPELWSVQDGAITGKTPADPAHPEKSILKHNTFLVWRAGKVGDFELTLEYRIVAGNSGIQYRSKELPKGDFGPIISGYQADFEAGKTYSGILYEERGRSILAKRGEQVVIKPTDEPKKPAIEKTGELGKSEDIQAAIRPEDWNQYRIVAKGRHLQHFINGHQTVDVTDQTFEGEKQGLLALQIHQGPPMTVQFRNLILKELK